MAKAKNTNEVAGKVKTYFASNPKKKQVYSTSDGYLFEVKKFATQHAQSIDESEVVETHKNPLLIEVEETEETETEE
jgi:uncharacterized pyridoxamine 5'-phosphate oxidase family protein